LSLSAAIAALNEQQRDAIIHEGNTVVLAGPGSGKTDTVVLKVAHLLTQEVRPPRGVACITFSADAVREFTIRLRRQGLRPGPRLFLGTVHSFCLTRIIRPYARLAGVAELAERTVASAPERGRLLQRALDSQDVSENPAYFDTTLGVIRKALACEESLDSFDPRHVAVAHDYEESLHRQRLIDFDGMTFEALRLLQTDSATSDLLVARYPWVAVDEYQDLGGPLHKIVLCLHSAGTNIFAVGDPDQCVFGFSGANPRYLNELEIDPSFYVVRLRFNYRAGRRLIDAAEAALDVTRGYEADPNRTDEGEVILNPCPPGLEYQARSVIDEFVPALLESGVPAHEIAILYRGRGPMLDVLTERLAAADLPYILERDETFPITPLIKWLQRCAIWELDPTAPDIDGYSELVIPYLQLVDDAGGAQAEVDLNRWGRLIRSLDSGVRPEDPLGPWIRHVVDGLDLHRLLSRDGSRPDELESLSALERQTLEGDIPTISDFARGARVWGRIVVTTYHSSKGRQFDVVHLPGLQETIMPGARWNREAQRNETPEIVEDRRLFYVALTRARRQVVLTYSPSFTNRYGYRVQGHSRFVDEIASRLSLES